jgi:hypothetical protein
MANPIKRGLSIRGCSHSTTLPFDSGNCTGETNRANLKYEIRSKDASVDMKLEVVVIPVSDVERTQACSVAGQSRELRPDALIRSSKDA